jgi:hypothetical protein
MEISVRGDQLINKFVLVCVLAASLLLPAFAHAEKPGQPIRTGMPGCGDKLANAQQSFVFNANTAITTQAHFGPGTNILYWIDTKKDWNEFNIGASLSELGIKALRFPGGEVADNYDWEKNEIERDDQFPKEAASIKEKENRLDFRTFLKHADELGIRDIYFVVNLEGAFMSPGNRDENIRAYAKKAARWVEAVKKSGHHVKYWEIGNESYLHSAFPLTAKEYADALRIFSKEMKSADPSIKIGAIGPLSAKGDKAIGFADEMHPETRETYRKGIPEGKTPCRKQNLRECAMQVNKGRKHQGDAWWTQVARYASDSFDFAVVHRYGYYPKKQHKNKGSDFGAIASLKKYLMEATGREVPIAITEWNVPESDSHELADGDHAVEVAAQLLGYYRSGVQDALYWPFRMKGNDSLALVNQTSGKKFSAYEVLRLVAGPAGEYVTLFPAESLPHGVEVIGYGKGNEATVIAVNNSEVDSNLAWVPSQGRQKYDVSITQLSSQGDRLKSDTLGCPGVHQSKPFTATLPPKSVVKISFQPAVGGRGMGRDAPR